jgi:spore cortex formation protein SpoVR/YcgB (stage V sporulation)
MEFFTEEFCNKYEFFEWEKFPNGEYKIKSRDHKSIKSKLIRRHLNGGLPNIQLVDSNYQNKRRFLLQHQWDGRVLYVPYVKATLTSIHALWQNDILLATKNKDSEEIVYFCNGVNEEDVFVLTREECEGLTSELDE